MIDETILGSKRAGWANSARSLGQRAMAVVIFKDIVALLAVVAIVALLSVILVVFVVDALRKRGFGFILVIGNVVD